jgi:indolepyruvate ferredoxin oxidoreductase
VNGEADKHDFGPWVRGALRLLAQGRRLRGTPFDPLGRNAERRLDRALVAEYWDSIERLLSRLDTTRLDAALALAEWPAGIRGFAAVRQRRADEARARLPALLAACEAAAPAAVVTA